MGLESSERARLSAALFARGFVLLAFAAVAIRWPDETLFFALVGAGAAMAMLGIFQLGMHVASRELPSTKVFLLGDGFTTLTFGIGCLVLPMLNARMALLLAAVWLFLYTASLLLLAARLWFLPTTRHALLAWAVANLACGVAAVWLRAATLGSALYAVAAYAWCYAVAHVAAGLWLRRRHRMILARASSRLPHQGIHHAAAR